MKTGKGNLFMKNVKYIVTAVLLVCMLALTLAACNNTPDNPGEETTQKAGATTAVPTPGTPTTEAPTTEEPTTETPTTEEPTTEHEDANVEPDANADADKLTPATDEAEDFGQLRPL